MKKESNYGNTNKVEAGRNVNDSNTFDAILNRLESGQNGSVSTEGDSKWYAELPGWSV